MIILMFFSCDEYCCFFVLNFRNRIQRVLNGLNFHRGRGDHHRKDRLSWRFDSLHRTWRLMIRMFPWLVKQIDNLRRFSELLWSGVSEETQQECP